MSKARTKTFSSQKDFSFKNLQPINYLKTFNKMLDYMNTKSSTNSVAPSQKQLKTIKLSKFPLHQYYYQMQGILQSSNKKNQDEQKQNKNQMQFQKFQEKFLDNHYKFVKDTLQKIIEDNQSQQKNLQKSQNYYKMHSSLKNGSNNQSKPLRMIKLRSQPKLISIKNSADFHIKNKKEQNQKNIKNISLVRKKTLIDQSKNTQFSQKHDSRLYATSKISEPQNYSHNPIFKKLQAPKKHQKFRPRKFQQIDSLLSARKTLRQKNQKMQTTKYPLTQRKRITQNEKNYNSTIHTQSFKNRENYNQNYNKLKQVQKGQSHHVNIKFSKPSFVNDRNNLQNEEQQEGLQIFSEKDMQQFRKQIAILPLDKEIQDQDAKFFRQLQYLKDQKTTFQNNYESVIDKKIKQAKQQLNHRIRQVYMYDFSLPKINKNKQNQISNADSKDKI